MNSSTVRFALAFLAGGALVSLLAFCDREDRPQSPAPAAANGTEAEPESESPPVATLPEKKKPDPVAPVNAQEPPAINGKGSRLQDLRIGIVNLKDCFDKEKYAHVRDLETEMSQKLEDLKKDLESLRKEITNFQEKLKDLPTDSELFQELRSQLALKQAEYRAKKDVGETDLKELTRKYRSNIYDEVILAIREISKKEKLDIVLKADAPPAKEEVEQRGSVEMKILYRAVLYHSEKLDITEKVLEKLNRDYEERKKKRFGENKEGDGGGSKD